MRLVVLGSGTGVPSGTRASSGYWLEAGGARMRLDCGPGTTHAMARYRLPWETITHQWISHFHIDHALEIPALLFALKHGRGQSPGLRGPLTLVGPQGLRRLVGDVMGAFRSDLLEQSFPVQMVEIGPGLELPVGGGAILRVAKTPHTGESLAVRIDVGDRAIGYTGDTAATRALATFFAGVDLLIAETSFMDDHHGTRHLRADDTAALATQAAVGHLVAVHAYFDPEHERLGERLARGFAGKITVATDGARFELEER